MRSPDGRSQLLRSLGRCDGFSVLIGLDEKDAEAQMRVKAFRLGMRDLGWIEGRNVQIEIRFAGSNLESINKHVAEVTKLGPDVIVANSTPVIAALRASTTPIIFAMVNDPVGQGFISSLARPGANITGFSFLDFEMVGKWVALMFNPDTAPYFDAFLRSFKTSQQPAAVDVQALHVRSATEVDLAFAELGRNPGSGLIAASDIFIVGAREAILKSAEAHRVPVISPYRQFVIEGSLMFMGPIPPTSSDVPVLTLTAFSRANRRAICQCNRRPSLNSFSILRRPRPSASRFEAQPCSSPTR